ncbi:hypothetical protein BASA50_011288 [Batrachochytrium salamandrivorans]|uniref:DNA repair protein SWI5 homolog n=1 Tax=Batrachochytrium salamandrivorans TaxID=1357716 RepID=A0ABQ8EW73_9FUNG|nr:hypothetical protein BASA60_007864 [Batrachochytrium salamandrivorans]KAH6587684.1 hypothetical protein BASA50_011288 [Batrachochytrium salamandrivorans]KAH6602270.1 hypothetical protein BASA61_001328 [Batrachochytrium salamandrivorans]KAH9274567.1 hypothetical protein BASA83_003203 [Batrachochytrium salamandrivorans]
MERLLLGHFTRHSRPATYTELSELAELLADDQRSVQSVLADLVRTQQILHKTIRLDGDAESVEVCYWPGQEPPNSRLARTAIAKTPTGPSPEILKLKKQKETLQQEANEMAASLPGDVDIDEFIQAHIKRLHDYNEIKDVGQMLLGKCAEREQTTTREMYVRFGLDFED